MSYLYTIFGWSIFFIAMVFLLYSFVTEYMWQSRSKISFESFQQHSKYYSYQAPKKFPFMVMCYTIFVILYILFVNNKNEYTIFVVMSYGSLLILLFSTYMIYSRLKKNRDLTPIQNLYESVQNRFKDIENVQAKKSDFEALLDKFVKENLEKVTMISPFLNQTVKFDLEITLDLLHRLITECEQIIRGLDNGLQDQFNNTLEYFLRHNQLNPINISTKNKLDMDVNIIAEDITNLQIENINHFLIEVTKQNGFSEEKSIIIILNIILTKWKIDLIDSAVESILLFIKDKTDIRENIIDQLLASKSIDENRFTKLIVDKEQDWLIKTAFMGQLKNSNHIEISDYLIYQNKAELSFVYLLGLNKQQLSIISIVLSKTHEKNETRQNFETYQKIMNSTVNAEFSKTTKEENLYYILKKHMKHFLDRQIQDKLDVVTLDSDIYKKETVLEELYNKGLSNHKPLYETTFRFLFIWNNSVNFDVYFDVDNVNQITDEFQKHLKVNELIHLLLLLGACMLSEKNSNNIKNTILHALEDIIDTYKLKSLNVLAQNSNYIQVSELIIKYLIKDTNYPTTLNIVNRIEKNRLFMEQLENYSGGNWK